MAERFRLTHDNKGRQVMAKTVVDAFGNDIIDPKTGDELVAPNNYDVNSAVAFGRSLRNIPRAPTDEDGLGQRSEILAALGKAFWYGPQDLQRTYNNVIGGGKNEFVDAFRPIASFHFGVAARASGLTRAEIMAGGGLFNLYNKYNLRDPNPTLDTSGLMFNNPQNVKWIDEGIKAYDSGRLLKRTPMNDQGDDAIQLAASPGSTAVSNQTAPGLPQPVIDAGNYLRANGYEITPRSMYVASVLGPQRAVDLFNRTGSTSSDEVPSPDAATGRQVLSWVRALRLGPAAPTPPAPPDVAASAASAPTTQTPWGNDGQPALREDTSEDSGLPAYRAAGVAPAVPPDFQ
jgi:hypothetical protein